MDNPTRTDATRWHTTLTAPLREGAESSFEHFEHLTQKLLKVPKEEVDEKRAEREKKRTE
jgi:hypothetical protein